MEGDGSTWLGRDHPGGKDQDVHGPKLWGFLTELARKGAIKCVLGGPPCRTVSRMSFKRPGPRPLRDCGEGRFGPPHLSAGEQRLADHDTALVLKQLAIFYMAEEARLRHGLGEEPTGFLLESPEDPGKNKLGSMMPSFWSWEELQDLASEEGMNVSVLISVPWDIVERSLQVSSQTCPTCWSYKNLEALLDKMNPWPTT